MGNLKQEHQFRTDGDGIAQWNGARLDGLLRRDNHRELTTQLDYMIYELEGYERRADMAIRQSNNIEQATIIFQNLYERCNPYYCMQDQRINYAYAILERNGDDKI